MDELGIGDKMRWVPTSMAYCFDGGLYRWGDPISLLRFPNLSMVEKLRYGLMMFSRRGATMAALESCRQGLDRKLVRAAVYERLWQPLFDLKFYEYADNISAAWIWTRIKRVGTSRRSLFQEELGYIEGGSETLVSLVASNRSAGRPDRARGAGDQMVPRRACDRRGGGRPAIRRTR